MGHIVFIFLHLAAIFFSPLLLMLTVPLHLIYGAIRSNSKRRATPHPDTHVRCPDCRELILKEAKVCKHCGCRLIPQK